MLRFVPEGSALRGAAREAASSFSQDQLTRMDRAGVVLVPNEPASLPAGRVSGMVSTAGASEQFAARPPTVDGHTRGRYLPELRTIQVKDSTANIVIHELAHAWDDVRNDNHRLTNEATPTTQQALAREDRAHTGFASDQTLERARLAYVAGQPTPNDEGRGPSRLFSLAAPPEESRKNAREFYAEGFAVFHRGSPEQLDVLRRQAPALYQVLYREARRERTLGSQPAPELHPPQGR
jgi:hypothetical protein